MTGRRPAFRLPAALRPALKAGIPAKVISERLGHATAAFTLQTYTHVIPGMDQMAADAIARMILTPAVAEADADGSILGSIADAQEPETSEEPADLLCFRRSAGSPSSSGGSSGGRI